MEGACSNERVRGSNPNSAGHFGGGWQFAVTRGIITPDLVLPRITGQLYPAILIVIA